MGELAQRIYTNYCTDESASCARCKLYENGVPYAVPQLMLPNQLEWASQILDEIKIADEISLNKTKSTKKQL